jgi:hypothetical protein
MTLCKIGFWRRARSNRVEVQASSKERKISFGIVGGLVLWLGVVCVATVLMVRYSNTPQDDGAAPGSWPVESRISFDSTRPNLLMFVHPHCPCSRASLGELDRLLAEVSKPPTVRVIFVKPPGTASDWTRTDLWREASSMKYVRTYLDDRGLEAQRFHAETSGLTLLYDQAGILKFQGGITFARGHEGDNAGRTAIREFLQEGHSNLSRTPVFGCSLLGTAFRKGDIVWKR